MIMIADAGRPFTAQRSELPMIYVLLAIASIELLVLHILVSMASTVAAWVLSGVTVIAMLQIVGMVGRVKRRPTLMTNDGLMIRSAKGFEVALPWSRIAAIEPIGFGPAPSGNGVIRAAILAHPNIHVVAKDPFTVRRLGRQRSAWSMTLRVDEPGALIAAAQSRLEKANCGKSAGRMAEGPGEESGW